MTRKGTLNGFLIIQGIAAVLSAGMARSWVSPVFYAANAVIVFIFLYRWDRSRKIQPWLCAIIIFSPLVVLTVAHLIVANLIERTTHQYNSDPRLSHSQRVLFIQHSEALPIVGPKMAVS